MKDKPHFKIRAAHIPTFLISGLIWIGFIALAVLLTSCLQSVSAIAPEATPQKAIPPKVGAPIAELDIVVIPAPQSVTLRTVCAETLYVRGDPSKSNTPIRYLSRGEVIAILEWDKRGAGWAMIAPAEWINADFLCKESPDAKRVEREKP